MKLKLCGDCDDQYGDNIQENGCLLCWLMDMFVETREFADEFAHLENWMRILFNENAATFDRNTAKLDNRIAELSDGVNELEYNLDETHGRLMRHLD